MLTNTIFIPQKLYDRYPHLCGLFGVIFMAINLSPFITISGISLCLYSLWVIKQRLL
jgi:hypothetical protein